jgi:hypothetical protein
MATHDFAGLVAALSFPIVTGAGLPDAPDTELAMRDQVSAMIAAGDGATPDTPAGHVEGMGIGFEILASLDIAHVVIEALLAVSLHIGLKETYESLRHWRTRHPADVPGFATLAARSAEIRAELEDRLKALGLPDDQAHSLSALAEQAILNDPARAAPEKDKTPPL